MRQNAEQRVFGEMALAAQEQATAAAAAINISSGPAFISSAGDTTNRNGIT